MAANYYYGFGHGGGQFSLSSGSYPGGYSAPSSSSRSQQQTYSEPHSQLPYNAFTNQVEPNLGGAGYGESKAYYMSTSHSTSVPSYTSSTVDEPRYNLLESKYPAARYLSQTTSHNSSDPSPYVTSVASKSPYAGSKPPEWHNIGASGSHSGHSFPVSDGLATSQPSSEAGFDSSVFKAAASYYRDLTVGNQSTASGNRKPFSFGTRPRPRQPPKPSQLHYCEVCRISCAGSQTYMEHLEGKNHKKKEAQAKAAETSTAKSPSSSALRQLYCQLCDVACTGADTYAAHIRGAKHQKVLNLHTKLGKPIPDVPTADAVVAGGAKGATVMTTASGAKKVIFPMKLNFVGGVNEDGSAEDKADGPPVTNEPDAPEDEDIQPVGLEYIEESRNEMGSAVSFHCKLCDCSFTDPLAKVMHTKGRRHRLHYKQKVDPTLQVSMKPVPNQRYRQMNRQLMKVRRHGAGDEYWRRRYYDDPYRQEVEELRFEKELLQWQLSHALERYDMMPGHFPLPLLVMPDCRQAPETQDDRHVKAKHASIYPNEDDLAAVQSTVTDCENALKSVSDTFAATNDKQNLVSETNSTEGKEELKESAPDAGVASATASAPRELKAVVRVGALSKGLLLHGDLHLELVLLCSRWPTRTLLLRVMEEFVKQLEIAAAGKYNASFLPEDVGIMVTSLGEPTTSCSISLTSLAVKGGSTMELEAGDLVDHSKCLESLAALRHAKWFQGKASSLFSCVILVRILKDLCDRIPTWKPLSHWALELLTEKCLSSYGEPMHPGAGLRRILECIASGLLLNGGSGLIDPCEKEPTDVLSSLTPQQKEDITNSAQHALRLLTFGQIHKVLDMEALPSSGLPSHRRKRQRPDCQGQPAGDSTSVTP